MKKKLLVCCGVSAGLAAVVVGIVVIISLVFLSSIVNTAVKTGVEEFGPKATGATVTLDKVDISPYSGSGTIGGLEVGNPEGFKTDRAMYLGEASMKLDVGSIFSDVVVIEELTIDGTEVTYELGMGGSNIAAIKKNVEAFAGLDKEKPAEPEEPGKKIIIKKLVFTNGTMRPSATLFQGKALNLPLPDLTLTDIGAKSNGATIGEAINQALGEFLGGALQVGEQLLGELKNLGVKILDSGEGILEEGKGLLEGAKDEAEKIKDIFK